MSLFLIDNITKSECVVGDESLDDRDQKVYNIEKANPKSDEPFILGLAYNVHDALLWAEASSVAFRHGLTPEIASYLIDNKVKERIELQKELGELNDVLTETFNDDLRTVCWNDRTGAIRKIGEELKRLRAK